MKYMFLSIMILAFSCGSNYGPCQTCETDVAVSVDGGYVLETSPDVVVINNTTNTTVINVINTTIETHETKVEEHETKTEEKDHHDEDSDKDSEDDSNEHHKCKKVCVEMLKVFECEDGKTCYSEKQCHKVSKKYNKCTKETTKCY
jgi:hypothetical protein